jgi:hypothetical protein
VEAARREYRQYAEVLKVFDFHSHSIRARIPPGGKGFSPVLPVRRGRADFGSKNLLNRSKGPVV